MTILRRRFCGEFNEEYPKQVSCLWAVALTIAFGESPQIGFW
jgi:hypothetical protein